MSQTASLTCFILLPLRDILEPKQKMQKSIRLALAMAWDFPCKMYPKAPKAKKSCSSWLLGECHLKAPSTKTNMTNGIQLLTVAVFSTFKCASFSLKMQPMKWYEWVRCGSWRLWGSSPHKGRRHLANGMPRVRLDEKQHMNVTWLRTPQNLLANAYANAYAKSGADSKTHSRSPWSWGSGFSLRDWPNRFVSKIALISQPVDTRSLRSARRRIMGKFMIDIWSLKRLAWLSRLSTLSESYTPQKQVWNLTSWKHDTACEASICLVNS